MELKNQVTNLELSKKLKKLGVKQDSYWYHVSIVDDWYDRRGEKDIVDRLDKHAMAYKVIASAFTCAELGEMLPDCIKVDGKILFLHISRDKQDSNHFIDYLPSDFDDDDECNSETLISSKTEADSRAEMRIYLIENKLIDLNVS